MRAGFEEVGPRRQPPHRFRLWPGAALQLDGFGLSAAHMSREVPGGTGAVSSAERRQSPRAAL